MLKAFKIGDFTLDIPIILAPMAGVTDLPFRLLCTEQGAGLCCMEMVSAKALLYKNKNTDLLLRTHPKEGPLSLQLFGADPDIMGDMAARLEESEAPDRRFDIIDINMGCPVPKVVNNNEGSALMKDPVLAGRIIESMVRSVKKPVTVKIRKGFDENSVNAVELAHVAQESGAAAITVHGRTRDQYYSGRADWDIIRQVVEAVSIPVIANGDVVDGPSAAAILETTGAAGLAVARAAQGNPWIFREIRTYLETGCLMERPGVEEIKATLARHADMLAQEKGEYITVREMRKHAGWYLAGRPGAAALRRRICEAASLAELDTVINDVI